MKACPLFWNRLFVAMMFTCFLISGNAQTITLDFEKSDPGYESKVYVISVNEPGVMNVGSTSYLIDSFSIQKNKAILDFSKRRKIMNQFVRLQIVPRGKDGYGYFAKSNTRLFAFIHPAMQLKITIGSTGNFSSCTVVQADAPNESIMKFNMILISRNNRMMDGIKLGNLDFQAFYKEEFNKDLTLFQSTRSDQLKYLLAQELCDFRKVIDPETFQKSFSLASLESFSKSFQESGRFASLRSYIIDQTLEVDFEKIRNLVFLNTSLKPAKISYTKPKVTVVALWASWCKPCRVENKTILKQIYKSFSEKDVQIISISMDTKVDAWKKAYLSDGLPWNHYIDTSGMKSAFAKAVQATSLPRIIVFDAAYNNIGNDLLGESLVSFVRQEIRKK